MANTGPSFIGLGYDWSGVGWANYDDTRSQRVDNSAANTDRQPLFARLRLKHPVRLRNRTGDYANLVQSQVGSYGGDIGAAQFTGPIPQNAGISNYSVLFQGYNPNTYAGYNLLNYGWTASIGWNKIDSVNTGTGYAGAISIRPITIAT